MKARTYANRGKPLENFIEYANERYKILGEGFICKVPTEFIPLRNARGQIYNVKVEHKATFDFLGHFRGHPIAIEAKNTNQDTIRWDAVQENQYRDMNAFCQQSGTIGLVVVSFNLQEFYAVPWVFWREAYELRVLRDDRTTERRLKVFGEEWTIPKKKSVRMDELSPLWKVSGNSVAVGVDYLRNAERYLKI